jgi:hypothetical protein
MDTRLPVGKTGERRLRQKRTLTSAGDAQTCGPGRLPVGLGSRDCRAAKGSLVAARRPTDMRWSLPQFGRVLARADLVTR